MKEEKVRRSPFDLSSLLDEESSAAESTERTSLDHTVGFDEVSTESGAGQDRGGRLTKVLVGESKASAGAALQADLADAFEWQGEWGADGHTNPAGLEGTRLGPYRIEARIGAGTFSHVYRAREANTGRVVAVKVLRHRFGDDESLQRRFRAEGHALVLLTHPNVVQHHAVSFLEDGRPYLVMELLPGGTLRQAMAQRRRFSRAELVALLLQITRGLDALHAAGLVHRDLKPGNIALVSTAGLEVAKILDLGVARFLAPNDLTRLTQDGALIGTPAYMAPEQIESPSSVGPSADLYALGIIAYELLSGRRPFSGSTEEVADAHRKRAVPPLETKGGLEQLVLELLEKDPARRPESAQAVMLRLQALTERGGVSKPWLLVAAAASLSFLFVVSIATQPSSPVEPSTKDAPSQPEAEAPPPEPVRVETTNDDAVKTRPVLEADTESPKPVERSKRPPAGARREAPRKNARVLEDPRSASGSTETNEVAVEPAPAATPSVDRKSLERQAQRVLGLLQLAADSADLSQLDAREARYFAIRRKLEAPEADLAAIGRELTALEKELRRRPAD